MNINILFAISSLNFTINFKIDANKTQDLFFFAGYDKSAHLFRENKTVFLDVYNGNNFSSYYADIRNKLEFSWNGFKVNNTVMNNIESRGMVKDLTFDLFSFNSPFEEIIEKDIMNPCKNISTFIDGENINYWYILLIVLLIGSIFDLKPKMMSVLRNTLKNHIRISDNDDNVTSL